MSVFFLGASWKSIYIVDMSFHHSRPGSQEVKSINGSIKFLMFRAMPVFLSLVRADLVIGLLSFFSSVKSGYETWLIFKLPYSHKFLCFKFSPI